MSAERLIPGGPFANETATAQQQIPGSYFINQTVSAAAAELATKPVIVSQAVNRASTY